VVFRSSHTVIRVHTVSINNHDNPRAIRTWRHNGEIAPSLVGFLVKGSNLAKGLVKRGIEAVGLWYEVEIYMNMGPDSRCELCCGWGHIKHKRRSKHTSGYCSDLHQSSDIKCHVLGCTVKHGSLWGHTRDKCTTCRGNHIAFSNRCAEKTEAAKAALQSGGMGVAWPASANAASKVASGTNRRVRDHRPNETANEAGGSGAELVHAEEEEAIREVEDVTIADIATMAAAETGSETAMGALATNDSIDLAQLC